VQYKKRKGEWIIRKLGSKDNNKKKHVKLPETLPPRPVWLPDMMDEHVATPFNVGFSLVPFGINGHRFNHTASLDIPLNTINEFQIARTDTILAQHPYHQHVNSFQVIDYEDKDLPYNETGLQLGSFRDTIPTSFTPGTTIRFLTHAFPGKMVFHCHVITHSDTGMFSFAEVNGPYKRYTPTKVKSVSYPMCENLQASYENEIQIMGGEEQEEGSSESVGKNSPFMVIYGKVMIVIAVVTAIVAIFSVALWVKRSVGLTEDKALLD